MDAKKSMNKNPKNKSISTKKKEKDKMNDVFITPVLQLNIFPSQ